MATNNEKVTAFLSSASDLMKTSKRMEDIFNMTMKRNEKKVAVQYINSKGKIKKYRQQVHTYVNAFCCSGTF